MTTQPKGTNNKTAKKKKLQTPFDKLKEIGCKFYDPNTLQEVDPTPQPLADHIPDVGKKALDVEGAMEKVKMLDGCACCVLSGENGEFVEWEEISKLIHKLDEENQNMLRRLKKLQPLICDCCCEWDDELTKKTHKQACAYLIHFLSKR